MSYLARRPFSAALLVLLACARESSAPLRPGSPTDESNDRPSSTISPRHDPTSIEATQPPALGSSVPRVDRPPTSSAVTPRCPSFGTWGWDNPRPQGDDLISAWAIAPDDVWAGAASGALLHWDGSIWSTLDSGASNIQAVWASSDQDVWTIASPRPNLQPELRRFDGTSWSTMLTDITGSGLWGSGPADVWVGSGFGIRRFDGTRWSQTWTYGAQTGVRTIIPDQTGRLWSDADGVCYWDGTVWQGLANSWGVGDHLWIAEDRHPWMGGPGPKTMRWDDAAWNWIEVPLNVQAPSFLTALGGTGPRDLWVALTPDGDSSTLLRGDSQSWIDIGAQVPGAIQVFAKASPSDLWAFGTGGVIARWDGATWRVVSTGTILPLARMRSTWAAGADDVWAVGADQTDGLILHRDASGWTAARRFASALFQVWGLDADHVWAVGDAGTVLRWNGADWQPLDVGTSSNLRAIWGSSPTDLWISGVSPEQSVPELLHFDGSTWSTVIASVIDPLEQYRHFELTALWGGSSDDVWAVGINYLGRGCLCPSPGAMFHWDGAHWSQVQYTTDALAPNLTAIWGNSWDDVWAAGDFSVLHFDGYGWSTALESWGMGIEGLWGSGRDDVWAVGKSIAHFDGRAWTTIDVPARKLSGITGHGCSAWAVGEAASVLALSR
jgi:hypothetical protein